MFEGSQTPPFKAGDIVTVRVPGPHRGKRGIVTAVRPSRTGDGVYRYSVQFLDETSATFFGFELERKSEIDQAS